MQSTILNTAVHGVETSLISFCRFITANDTGLTGSHQSGFYIPKCASNLLFDKPGIKNENKDKHVKIRWQDSFETDSRFIYYGKGTRNEYRITRFGKSFPFLSDNNVGDLFILAKQAEDYYLAYVLSSDDDIEAFLSHFNISPNCSNQLISTQKSTKIEFQSLLNKFVDTLSTFPETKAMAEAARNCYNKACNISEKHYSSIPDTLILEWIDTEYTIFKSLEEKIYAKICGSPFSSIDDFIKTANEILNRRKSRAGKSLEHHLSAIFNHNNLIFEEQAVTEDNKKPDFLFPNSKLYHNFKFPSEYLAVLGAKTTCKDRWRQVITEADRVDTKYIFTLQQGISKNQLKEMGDSNVKLVVPAKYKSSFPIEYRDSISTLCDFISTIKEQQSRIPKTFLLK